MKLKVGSKIPDFNANTPYRRGIKLSKILGEGKTAILFLRYEGCTLCRFDMMNLKDDYDKIKEVGGKVLVVLQSDSDKLSKEIKEDYFPFEIICDPEQGLYKQFEIKGANSQEEMIGQNSMEKLKKVQESGLIRGEYEGEELQLPAAFVVDRNLIITYAHYAVNITDMPDNDELITLLS